MRHVYASACLVLACGTASVLAQSGIELPIRRAGQWEIAMTMGQSGMQMSIQACTDPASDRRMMSLALGQMGETCERYDVSRQGQDFLIDAVCQMGPMRVTSRTQITGDFQSRYTVRVEGTMTGQGESQAMRMVQEARWVSEACTGGLVAGDIVLPSGQKVNINRMPGGIGGQ